MQLEAGRTYQIGRQEGSTWAFALSDKGSVYQQISKLDLKCRNTQGNKHLTESYEELIPEAVYGTL